MGTARPRALVARTGQLTCVLLFLSALLPAGCQSTLPQNRLAASNQLPVQAEVAQVSQTTEPNEIVPTAMSISTTPSALENSQEPSYSASQQSPVSQEQAMAEVLDKLQAIEAIDPEAKKKLMADLHRAKPEHWSLIVQQFQTALAFRQQLATREDRLVTREAQRANQDASEDVQPDPLVIVSTDQATIETSQSANTSPKPQVDNHLDNSPYPHTGATKQVVSQEIKSSSNPTDKSVAAQQEEAVAVQLSPPPAGKSTASPKQVQSASYQLNTSNLVGHSDAGANPSDAGQKSELDRAIAQFEQSVTDEPGSIDDIHEQMRLRLLYLLARRDDDALRPIPGATPAQQDYWSKQLFAMTTFLDNQSQPDNKRRAAAALTHLDQARGTLSELATLQVRNLSFVTSVDGFGGYRSQQETKFKPGEQVTLYAEVDNFRSESTEQGYRTTLGTSYQVVDKNGHRVDGGQFPEVLDRCKNHRRDFHIQYGIALPTRIYAGSYELQLIVTDNQTGKIGQATLPFEIVE